MEKILIIQTAFIGDAILTLPMIEKLKEKFPSNDIDVLCIPSTQEVFEASPFVRGVLVMDKKKAHRSIHNLYKFTIEIKERNYTKIYSPQGNGSFVGHKGPADGASYFGRGFN